MLMNKKEAQTILDGHLAGYAKQTYTKLVTLVEAEHIETFEVRSDSGVCYQVEVQFIWDDRPGGAVRILGNIDDGGIRAIFPLGRSELVPPPEAIKP